MAHEIDMSNNRANMAFIGQRSKIWHGLGIQLDENSSIETWIKESGLDWSVKESDVFFNTDIDLSKFNTKKVLFRSDTLQPLSIVGDQFKIVQPVQIVEFFRDLVEKHDMKLSTAGSLFGGKRFWALAELGKEIEIVNGDLVKGYLLLTTSVDGTLKTTGKFISERVVCNNTLSIALNESTKNVVAVSHKSEWDPDLVKVDLGLLDSAWYTFINNMRKLANTPVNNQQAKQFYQEMIFKNQKQEPTGTEIRKVDDLLRLYQKGIGYEYSAGTAWGVLNAMTQMWTHGTGRKQSSTQFWDSNVSGTQNQMKTKGLNKLLELV